jgi:hypothetical protein
MPQKISATKLAKERDEYKCQWHLLVWEQLRDGSDSHHLFRPRKLYDETQYIVTLCHECHLGLRHSKGAITDRDIIERVMIPYIWNGEDLTPKGF